MTLSLAMSLKVFISQVQIEFLLSPNLHLILDLGLQVVPSAVSLDVQKRLLDCCLHRDLSNPVHQTNIDLHYELQRPTGNQSFFHLDPSTVAPVQPFNKAIHKSLSLSQLLSKKLRWMTLGGQYDWTRKVYPDEIPPRFPSDIAGLLKSLFPNTEPEAAIFNLYSPGDTLSLHRDVSEECDRGLISLSIGCDCLFLVGLESTCEPDQTKHLTLRLRSGDIVYMTGSSRFAWHSVPLVVGGTCPEGLRSWPGRQMGCSSGDDNEDEFKYWANWMSSKRINLNVRQMRS